MEATSAERREAAEALYRLQIYGQGRAEALGVRYEDIPDLVENVLANPDPKALAQARLICEQIVAPYIVDGPGVEELSPAELLVRAMANSLEAEYPGLGESMAQMRRGEGRKVRSAIPEAHV